MSLADSIQSGHLVIQTIRCRLLGQLSNGCLNFDELVIASRVPVRTVLIVLDNLLRNGDVVANGGLFRAANGPSERRAIPYRATHFENLIKSELADAYSAQAKEREAPVLMWSQRRLLPWSAIERAGLISHNAPMARKLVFFGDDDFVSPLVSALMRDTEVHVVDLDGALLERVKKAARNLGGDVVTHHSDVSAFASDAELDTADAVVSDPFPTADAGFERMFWQATNRVLKMGGLNISTISASHKPVGFERVALRALDESGFVLTHLEANLGKYEIFDFEFCSFEQEVLDRTRATPSVSQTKSIFVAEKLNSVSETSDFAFDDWSSNMASHYLTKQADASAQIELAQERGAAGLASVQAPLPPMERGLDIKLILPDSERENLPSRADATAWNDALNKLGVRCTADDVEELVRLGTSQDIADDGEQARLGLTIRAIESWSRT